MSHSQVPPTTPTTLFQGTEGVAQTPELLSTNNTAANIPEENTDDFAEALARLGARDSSRDLPDELNTPNESDDELGAFSRSQELSQAGLDAEQQADKSHSAADQPTNANILHDGYRRAVEQRDLGSIEVVRFNIRDLQDERAALQGQAVEHNLTNTAEYREAVLGEIVDQQSGIGLQNFFDKVKKEFKRMIKLAESFVESKSKGNAWFKAMQGKQNTSSLIHDKIDNSEKNVQALGA